MKTSKITLFFLLSLFCLFNVSVQAQVDVDFVEEIPITDIFSSPVSSHHDNTGAPFLYVCTNNSGLKFYHTSPGNPAQLYKTLSTQELQINKVAHLQQVGNLLYLALGAPWQNSSNPGMAIVDISDPWSPVVRDVIFPSPNAGNPGCSQILIRGDYAYLSAMGAGLMIFDISDPDQIAWKSTSVLAPTPIAGTGLGVRCVALQNNLAFLAYDQGGMRVMDITSKTNPIELPYAYLEPNPSWWAVAKAYNHVTLNGNLAYIAADYRGVEVVDISDLNNMHQVGHYNPWNPTHNPWIWFSADGHTNLMEYNSKEQLLFVASAASELVVLDMSDPTSPTLVGSVGGPANNQAAWGASVFGTKVALSYVKTPYTWPYNGTWAGVRTYEWSLSSSGKVSFEQEGSNDLVQEVYPNPFHEKITVQIEMPTSQEIKVVVYDLKGQVVRLLAEKEFAAGSHELSWDGKSEVGEPMPAGVYLCQVIGPEHTENHRMIKQ